MKLKIRDGKSECGEIYLEESLTGNILVKSIVKGDTYIEVVLRKDGTIKYPSCEGNFRPVNKNRE